MFQVLINVTLVPFITSRKKPSAFSSGFITTPAQGSREKQNYDDSEHTHTQSEGVGEKEEARKEKRERMKKKNG